MSQETEIELQKKEGPLAALPDLKNHSNQLCMCWTPVHRMERYRWYIMIYSIYLLLHRNMTYLTTLLLSSQILLYYCIDVLKQGRSPASATAVCTQYLYFKAIFSMQSFQYFWVLDASRSSCRIWTVSVSPIFFFFCLESRSSYCVDNAMVWQLSTSQKSWPFDPFVPKPCLSRFLLPRPLVYSLTHDRKESLRVLTNI